MKSVMQKTKKQFGLIGLGAISWLLGLVALPAAAGSADTPVASEQPAMEAPADTEMAPESAADMAMPMDALWMSEFVSRAQLTTRVESREPVDRLTPQLLREDSNTRRVFFFTEIRGLRGEQVRHQWLHGDRVVADLTFAIGADRWRTWSSKLLPPRWLGDWRVRVLAMDGEILAEQRFSYR